MDKEELIRKVMRAAYTVGDVLHSGFLEAVYHNALFYELQDRGIKVEKEKLINVFYKGRCVGEYRADLLIDGWLIVELKAVHELTKEHEVQLVNYLTATKTETGLLINFGGDTVKIKRKYMTYNGD